MSIEKRKPSHTRPSDLPKAFLGMVTEIFSTNFDAGLKGLQKLAKKPFQFEAHGSVLAEEIVLAIALTHTGEMTATTVYASMDFDPKASCPTIQDLLNVCVDAIGSVYGELLAPKALENLMDPSLSALQNVPFEWTKVEIENSRVYLKVDRANPRLDQLADEWLKKNDPDLKRLEEENEEAMEDLFITGAPSKVKKGLH
jgi:hypothetical protein